MSAAVTAAAVSAATTTVEAATAVNRSATEAAADCAATSESTTVKAATSESTTVEATTSEPTSAEAAAEPRAGTDEQTTGEPARTVVTVRRAGVGVIAIVSVGADRSWADVAWADAHADCETLSISVRRQSQRGSEYCKDH